jgi:hypothetical protein
MYSLTIKSVTKATLQEDNSQFLDVELDITEDGDLVDTKRLGFPIDMSSEDIEAECEKYLETFVSDLQNAERSKVVEAKEKQADETINELTGKEINL